MLAPCWRLSASVHRYLSLHAPSNRLIARIRTHRRNRVIAAAGLASTMCLVLAVLGATAAQGDGTAWIGGVVGLLIWDSFKLAWVALLPVRTPGQREAGVETRQQTSACAETRTTLITKAAPAGAPTPTRALDRVHWRHPDHEFIFYRSPLARPAARGARDCLRGSHAGVSPKPTAPLSARGLPGRARSRWDDQVLLRSRGDVPAR